MGAVEASGCCAKTRVPERASAREAERIKRFIGIVLLVALAAW